MFVEISLIFIFAFLCLVIESERKVWEIEGRMGDRGEDVQHRATGWNLTRVAAIRTKPYWYELYPLSHRGAPPFLFLNVFCFI